jgi:hypothetical protein
MNNYSPVFGIKEFDRNIWLNIQGQAMLYGIRLKSKTANPALSELIERLYNSDRTIPFPHEKIQRFPTLDTVAILIDEYDHPLAFHLNDSDKLTTMREYLYAFYSTIKSRYKFIRFLFITGVTRCNLISPLSGLSSVEYITFNSKFSEICGFTGEEILSKFSNQLKTAHAERIEKGIMDPNSTVSDLYTELLDWYDGYRFNGTSKVLNPESVLKFFVNNSFQKYWYQNSSPNILEYLKLKNDDYYKFFSKNVTFKVTITQDEITELRPETSLLQTGFLTIGKIVPKIIESDDKTTSNSIDNVSYLLTIPNKEVKKSFDNGFLINKLYGPFSKPSISSIIKLYNHFTVAFTNKETQVASGLLSSIYDSIPYELHEETEAFYSSHLIPPLSHADGYLTAEKSSGEGRVDMFLNMSNDDVYVIELKFHPSPFRQKNEKLLIQQKTYPLSAESAVTVTLDHDSVEAKSYTLTETTKSSETQTKNEKRMELINHLLEVGIADAFPQIFV